MYFTQENSASRDIASAQKNKPPDPLTFSQVDEWFHHRQDVKDFSGSNKVDGGDVRSLEKRVRVGCIV